MTSLLCPIQKIVLALGEGEKRVMQIVRETGYAPQTVRKAINYLVRRGLAEERKEGKYVYVELTQQGNILLHCLEVISRMEFGERVSSLHVQFETEG